MIELDSVIKEFLVESYENLDQLDRDLVALEQDPHNRERLSSIFRTIHTIKGTCGFFGFSKLESISHVGENLLSRMRDGQLLLNADITSVLLALVDAVREILGHIERSGQEGDGNYERLVQTLVLAQESPSMQPAASQAVESRVEEPLAATAHPVPASAVDTVALKDVCARAAERKPAATGDLPALLAEHNATETAV